MGRDNFVTPKPLTAAQKREIPDILGAVLGTPEQMIRSELRYDYSLIPEAHRNQVQTAAVAIVKNGRTAQESLIEIGNRLIEVKELLEHGQFGEWCATEFQLSDRMARNMMNVARQFGDKSETVSVLSDSVLYMLAAPSTPEPARIQVIEQAKVSGASPTKAEVKRVIDSYKPAPVLNTAPATVTPVVTVQVTDRGNRLTRFATPVVDSDEEVEQPLKMAPIDNPDEEIEHPFDCYDENGAPAAGRMRDLWELRSWLQQTRDKKTREYSKLTGQEVPAVLGVALNRMIDNLTTAMDTFQAEQEAKYANQ